MALTPKIDIKNLTLIFGQGKAKKEALRLLVNGESNDAIRKKTKCAVGVREMNLTIHSGELFVIVGLSGSGKSSFLRCLNRLNVPTQGHILIDNENVLDYTKSQLRHLRRDKIAMVFQHFGLFSHRSVLGNVAYGLEIKGLDKQSRLKKSKEILQAVGLGGWEHYYPHQLSGGMKQRVGLARALANDPEILLMDEPYSALDPLIRRDMQNELLTLENYLSKTIIFITHDMNEAFKMGDRIALMRDGDIVQIGKPQEFFDNPKNDYVRDFIADVDKSRVIKVKQVMKPPVILAYLGDSRENTIEKMTQHNQPLIYVINQEQQLKGYVTLEKLGLVDDKKIDLAVDSNCQSISQQAFIHDVVSVLAEQLNDVPIVDSKHRFKGVVRHEDVIKAIS